MLFKLLISRARCKFSQQIACHRSFYDSRTKHDTIFAPATTINLAKGSPLGIIRVSGPEAKKVLYKFTNLNVVMKDKKSPKPSLPGTQKKRKLITARQVTLTKIVQPDTNELIDKGLVVWFSRPNSYTGEDVCEFHLHGSQAIMKTMLDSLGTLAGLRPAEAGEFTRRAVSNGKMSLLQAESIPDLIASKTDYQRRLALKGLDGATLQRYEMWIESLVGILAHLEASIDFGEDELIGEQEVVRECTKKLGQLAGEIDHFIKVSAHCREVIQTGIRAAILGKPNSGKSTFMNVLCQHDRSIVSDLSGTTRDVVEHSFELGGHALTLCDTAGLRGLTSHSLEFPATNKREGTLLDKHDSVEREGIKRALNAARKANLIFYLIDGAKFSGSEIDKQDIVREFEAVLQVLECDNKAPKMLHLVINKMDLNDRSGKDELDKYLEESQFLSSHKIVTTFISCKTKLNLDKLMGQLSSGLGEFVAGGQLKVVPPPSPHNDVEDRRFTIGADEGHQQHVVQPFDYVNERHLSLLKSTRRHLFEASKFNLDTIDKMAQHVRESVDYLSRIVGSVSNDDVIDVIFRDFCIGK